MGELQGNYQNYDSDEVIVSDSEDELDINDEENAIVINIDDNGIIVNLPVVAHPDIPDDVPIDDDPVDVNSDSGGESMNGSNHSNNDIGNNTDEEMINDFENDLENSSEEEILSDYDDQEDHNPADSDVDDDSDDEDRFINPFQETFTLNVEAEGFNEPLFAAGNANLQAVEKFILIVAKTLRFKECYKSMITSFKMANLGFNNAHFPNNMTSFWRIVNRRQMDFTNITVYNMLAIVGAFKTASNRLQML